MMENTLATNAERFLEHAPEPLCMASFDGSLRYLNAHWEDLMGFPLPELTLHPWFEWIHPDDRNRVEAIWEGACAKSVGASFEHRALHRDGSWIWLSWKISVDTERELVFGQVRDIGDQKRLQVQYLRAQRLESIGTLASGVSHDLNNILGPIILSAELLYPLVHDERSRKLIDTLRISSQRGAEIVKQILSFTRGKEGERCLVNLKHLINEVIKIGRETFPRNIDIKTNLPRDAWPIFADSTQMHQVLMNLCVNARDAMPQGGILLLATENVTVDAETVSSRPGAKIGSYLVLHVADNGTGIPPEVIPSIFDPFYSSKPDGVGTGLGLYTVQNIVHEHGGFIETLSTVGQGTRFKIYLPAAEDSKSSAQPPPESPSPPLGQGQLILVVDDERGFQDLTRLIFIQHGYRVVTASDGAEALAVFAQNRGQIDLVLMDIIMPHLDGVATIRALQRIDPNVRILASSGSSENEASALKLGRTRFLPKPFTANLLLYTVDQLIHSENAALLSY